MIETVLMLAGFHPGRAPDSGGVFESIDRELLPLLNDISVFQNPTVVDSTMVLGEMATPADLGSWQTR